MVAAAHPRFFFIPPAHPSGTIRKGQQVAMCSSLEPGKMRAAKVNELFVYDNFSRTPVDEVQAGDICALTGISDISVRPLWHGWVWVGPGAVRGGMGGR